MSGECIRQNIFERSVLALFGSFNPPTNGHLMAVSLAREKMLEMGLDVVKTFMIPVHSAYKKKGLLPSDVRVEMCEAVCKKTKFLEVEKFEVEQKDYTPTVQTLRYLRSKYNAHPFMVCGIDLVETFNNRDSWTEQEVVEILEDFGLCVLPRGRDNVDPKEVCRLIEGREKRVHMIRSNPLRDVSSTLVRKELASDDHIPLDLIDPDVLKIIKEKKLYKVHDKVLKTKKIQK